MSDDFCVFILTHGRPDNVITYETLKRQGYTGKLYIVIDDEDKNADQYRQNFGDNVLQFSKSEIAKTFDEGDNFEDRRCIIYARNACFELAEKVGCRYFIELDDDYVDFRFRPFVDGVCKTGYVSSLDMLFRSMLELYVSSGCKTMSIAQGGDYIGGAANNDVKRGYKRKAMNSFVCDTENPFKFYGRINEDVNFYTCDGRRGELIFQVYGVMLDQKQTQSNAGGMTDIYLDKGTYFKSFYSVMYSPSCVKIGMMGMHKESMRIHHKVNWNNCAPLILDEKHKRAAKL